jgi:hypothetical protein
MTNTDTPTNPDEAARVLVNRRPPAPGLQPVLAQKDPTTGVIDLYDTAGGAHLGRLDPEHVEHLQRINTELEAEVRLVGRELAFADDILQRLADLDPKQVDLANRIAGLQKLIAQNPEPITIKIEADVEPFTKAMADANAALASDPRRLKAQVDELGTRMPSEPDS